MGDTLVRHRRSEGVHASHDSTLDGAERCDRPLQGTVRTHGQLNRAREYEPLGDTGTSPFGDRSSTEEDAASVIPRIGSCARLQWNDDTSTQQRASWHG